MMKLLLTESSSRCELEMWSPHSLVLSVLTDKERLIWLNENLMVKPVKMVIISWEWTSAD